MGDVVNLRQARKAKARADGERKAANNRLKFGRRKDDKELMQNLENLREKNLDDHRLESPPPCGEG